MNDLVARWLERDRRYATRAELSRSEIDAITAWRRKEVDALPAQERSVAWGILTRWLPPKRYR
jgi:hypothetical protein